MLYGTIADDLRDNEQLISTDLVNKFACKKYHGIERGTDIHFTVNQKKSNYCNKRFYTHCDEFLF